MCQAISWNEVQITCILFFVSRSRRYFKLTLNAQNICVRKPSSERSFTFIVSECETLNRPTENSEIISHIALSLTVYYRWKLLSYQKFIYRDNKDKLKFQQTSGTALNLEPGVHLRNQGTQNRRYPHGNIDCLVNTQRIWRFSANDRYLQPVTNVNSAPRESAIIQYHTHSFTETGILTDALTPTG